MQFLKPSKMNPRPKRTMTTTRHGGRGATAAAKVSDMQTRPPAELVRTRGGVLDVPRNKLKLLTANGGCNDDQQQQHHQNQKKLTKLLLNVNIQNGLGTVQVVMSLENTVEDLIKAAIDVYVKEKRRPLLASPDPRRFQLHYSQFSLQSLRRDEKLMNLGSRNFFCCPKPSKDVAEDTKSSCCSDEVTALAAQPPFPSTKFMDFLL